jgi:hypothetical protein
MGDFAVSWKSKKQSCVALSSIEAAMCQAAKEPVWIVGLLIDLGINLKNTIIIFGDNQGSLALANNPIFHPRSTHIDIQYHLTRGPVASQQLEVRYILTDTMIADVLTKLSEFGPLYLDAAVCLGRLLVVL